MIERTNKSIKSEIALQAKLYIFMASSITQIGGAEIYVRNKCNYLKKKGWDVLVFSYCKGEILIEDLKEYESYILPDLRFVPFLFSHKRRMRNIERILSAIGKQQFNEIIIESNSMFISLWGELVAMQLQAKHFFFDLQEDDVIKSKGMLSYLKFKHQRKELVGIKQYSLQRLFTPFFDLPLEKAYHLPAYCTNSVEDIPCQILQDIPPADYCIASIGRLEKPYLQTAIADICEFITGYPEKTFNVMFVGGERNGSYVQKKIRKIFAKFPNVYLIITGFLFPIPLSLLRKADIYLSSAGSASITYRLGLPTISYDGNELQPIGIMGKTTTNTLFRENEIKVKGCDLLHDILIDKKYSFSFVPLKLVEYDYSSHMDFIYESDKTTKYFDFSNYETGVEDKIKFWCYRYFGYSGYEILSKGKAIYDKKYFSFKKHID